MHQPKESTLLLSRQPRENGASKLILLGWNSCDESWFAWGDPSRVGVLQDEATVSSLKWRIITADE